MSNKVIAIFALLVLTAISQTPDQMTIVIPGYTDHKWYSGYLNFTHGAFHYVFFQSQHDPDNDPVVLWLNGGPGCSSLLGMTYENGPFVFKPNTTQFIINQNSWNKKANLLYITSPQGVGFSIGNPQKLDDGTVAQYNLKALLQFFVKFPKMKKNDFYISGESYAGIYVPYLANQILNHNNKPSSFDNKIKLQGFLVGNACTDPRQCYQPTGTGMSIYQYQFLYKHAYISDSDYNMIVGACTLGYHSGQCIKIRQQVDKKFESTRTNLLNIYDLCYDQVYQNKHNVKQNGRKKMLTINQSNCDDQIGIHHYFNQPNAHINYHVNNMTFKACSDQVADQYIMFSNASYWLYPQLIKKGLRIWVYSGDVDADVPITGTLNWINRLRQQSGLVIVQPWRQWWVQGIHKHQDQVGGMVWHLKGFTFVSVRGAGHMVPQDKSAAAFVMFDSFINNLSMPQKSL